MTMIPAAATAKTPFGPLAGRTFVNVARDADDLAHISFLCGSTPVSFTLSGADLHDFITALIEVVAQGKRAELLAALEDARKGVAS